MVRVAEDGTRTIGVWKAALLASKADLDVLMLANRTVQAEIDYPGWRAKRAVREQRHRAGSAHLHRCAWMESSTWATYRGELFRLEMDLTPPERNARIT